MHPDYSNALNNIGLCHMLLGDIKEALECFLLVLSTQEKDSSKVRSIYAKSMNNIGLCFWLLDDYTKALEYYQQALTAYVIFL